LLYGLFCYAVFLATILYAIGFIGNFAVPNSLDSPRDGSMAGALWIDLGLLTLFGLQHSLMARPAFKRRLTRWIPVPLERSTYVLLSSLCLILLFWQWRPLGGELWHVTDPVGRAALLATYAFGWGLVVVSSFLINHFDLFGLRQAWLHFRGRRYHPLRFDALGPYRLVRHPLYTGWCIAVWVAPVMSWTHLVFALGTTAYILIGVRLEERDLTRLHREYSDYRRRVPMLLPFSRRRRSRRAAAEA